MPEGGQLLRGNSNNVVVCWRGEPLSLLTEVYVDGGAWKVPRREASDFGLPTDSFERLQRF